MSDGVQSDRDKAIIRVMKSLARLRAHGDVLPVRRSTGVAPIVVVLPSDRVGDVEEQVRDAGGVANVIIAETNGFVIWSWDCTVPASEDALQVHEHSTMEMFRLWCEAREDGIASYDLVRELAYQF
jgi:hypothetical protein